MLSVKYHVAYWAVAASAVAIYQLFILYRPLVVALQVAIGPLAAYTLHSSCKWHRCGKKTELALYTHQALVAYLLIAIGSVADCFQLPDEKAPKPTALIHALLAFVVVGSLESLRQNRHDIEPATFFLVQSGPRSDLLRFSWRHMTALLASTIVCDAILFLILLATDQALHRAGAMSLRHIVPSWGWEEMHLPGRLGSAVVAYYLGGPFADMAETIYFTLCRRFVPHLDGPQGWMPEQRPRHFVDLEVTRYVLFWAPRVLLRHSQGLPREYNRGVISRLISVLAG